MQRYTETNPNYRPLLGAQTGKPVMHVGRLHNCTKQYGSLRSAVVDTFFQFFLSYHGNFLQVCSFAGRDTVGSSRGHDNVSSKGVCLGGNTNLVWS